MAKIFLFLLTIQIILNSTALSVPYKFNPALSLLTAHKLADIAFFFQTERLTLFRNVEIETAARRCWNYSYLTLRAKYQLFLKY